MLAVSAAICLGNLILSYVAYFWCTGNTQANLYVWGELGFMECALCVILWSLIYAQSGTLATDMAWFQAVVACGLFSGGTGLFFMDLAIPPTLKLKVLALATPLYLFAFNLSYATYRMHRLDREEEPDRWVAAEGGEYHENILPPQGVQF